jgi:hypothetical protein
MHSVPCSNTAHARYWSWCPACVDVSICSAATARLQYHLCCWCREALHLRFGPSRRPCNCPKRRFPSEVPRQRSAATSSRVGHLHACSRRDRGQRDGPIHHPHIVHSPSPSAVVQHRYHSRLRLDAAAARTACADSARTCRLRNC